MARRHRGPARLEVRVPGRQCLVVIGAEIRAQPDVCERGCILRWNVLGPWFVFGAYCLRSLDPWSRVAALRRRKVPRSKSARLYGILRQRSLAFDARNFLIFDALKTRRFKIENPSASLRTFSTSSPESLGLKSPRLWAVTLSLIAILVLSAGSGSS
jgi:hypothetical protein